MANEQEASSLARMAAGRQTIVVLYTYMSVSIYLSIYLSLYLSIIYI